MAVVLTTSLAFSPCDVAKQQLSDGVHEISTREESLEAEALSSLMSDEPVAGLNFVSAIDTADIVSLHLPVTKETHPMINCQYLHSMKEGVCIVNVAERELINSDALYESLGSGYIGGARFDTFVANSYTELHFFALNNVILMPYAEAYA